MNTKKQEKQREELLRYNEEINMRSILQNAIKMQAMYSGKRVMIVESSKASN